MGYRGRTHKTGALIDVVTARDSGEAGSPPSAFLRFAPVGGQSLVAGGQPALTHHLPPNLSPDLAPGPAPRATPFRLPAAHQVWIIQAMGQDADGQGHLAPEEQTPHQTPPSWSRPPRPRHGERQCLSAAQPARLNGAGAPAVQASVSRPLLARWPRPRPPPRWAGPAGGPWTAPRPRFKHQPCPACRAPSLPSLRLSVPCGVTAESPACRWCSINASC